VRVRAGCRVRVVWIKRGDEDAGARITAPPPPRCTPGTMCDGAAPTDAPDGAGVTAEDPGAGDRDLLGALVEGDAGWGLVGAGCDVGWCVWPNGTACGAGSGVGLGAAASAEEHAARLERIRPTVAVSPIRARMEASEGSVSRNQSLRAADRMVARATDSSPFPARTIRLCHRPINGCF
jgi:hypothetical protein